MLTFYAGILKAALYRIPGSLSSNWLGLLWPAILVVVGEVIACLVYGWRFMIKKWKQATLIGFASLGVCYLLLFVYCALSENYIGYAKTVSDKSSLQSLVDSADARQSYAVLMAQKECAKQQGVNEALEKQNRDQQSTINNCQTEAIKLLSPPSEKLLVLNLYDVGVTDVDRRAQFLLLTNRNISIVHMAASCNVILKSATSGPAGGGPFSGITTLKNKQEFQISQNQPSFTPELPMVVDIEYTSTRNAQCTFSLQ